MTIRGRVGALLLIPLLPPLSSCYARPSSSSYTPSFVHNGGANSAIQSSRARSTTTSLGVIMAAARGGAAPRRILCYGDSLTAGTTFPSVCALHPYAPHLERELNNNDPSRNRGHDEGQAITAANYKNLSI